MAPALVMDVLRKDYYTKVGLLVKEMSSTHFQVGKTLTLSSNTYFPTASLETSFNILTYSFNK